MSALQRKPAPRIGRVPGVHGGEPIVRGTRVPVRAIVVAWRENQDLASLLEAYPRLSEADVLEALDYYQRHRQEIDERIRDQLDDL